MADDLEFIELDDRLALESLVSALILTLEEQGLLDGERLNRHLLHAEAQLDEADLGEAAERLDQWREFLAARRRRGPGSRGGNSQSGSS